MVESVHTLGTYGLLSGQSLGTNKVGIFCGRESHGLSRNPSVYCKALVVLNHTTHTHQDRSFASCVYNVSSQVAAPCVVFNTHLLIYLSLTEYADFSSLM